MKESSKYSLFVGVLGSSSMAFQRKSIEKPTHVNRMGSFSDYKNNVISKELPFIRSHYGTWIYQGIGVLGGLLSTKRYMVLSSGSHPTLKLNCSPNGTTKHLLKLDISTCFRFVNGKTLALKSGNNRLRLRFEDDCQARNWVDLIHLVLRHAQWLQQLRVVGDIGSDRGCRVVKCIHRKGNVLCAMKILDKGPEALSEVEIMIKLNSTTESDLIASCLRIFESGSKLFIVMPYYAHNTLLAKLEEEGCLSEKQAATITRGLVLGLGHLHKSGIIHCDIKLENLVFEHEDVSSIRIIDFGSAVRTSCLSPTVRTLLGTPGYIAPERLKGQNPIEVSDVFSAGVVLYQMLSARHPFTTSGKHISLQDSHQYDVSFQSKSWDDVSECAKDLVRKMLVEDPNERIDCKSILLHPWIVMYN